MQLMHLDLSQSVTLNLLQNCTVLTKWYWWSNQDNTVDFYEQTNYSIAFNVNDDLSVSYEVDEDNANYCY